MVYGSKEEISEPLPVQVLSLILPSILGCGIRKAGIHHPNVSHYLVVPLYNSVFSSVSNPNLRIQNLSRFFEKILFLH